MGMTPAVRPTERGESVETDEKRLASILRASNDGNTVVQWDEVARNALASGLILLPPAPVDPAWMAEAANLMTTAYLDESCKSLAEGGWQYILRALLAAGYRIIPPTQDRAAVIAKSVDTLRGVVNLSYGDICGVLYDAGMLVEGDGR